ncbi:hypothetical protein HK104_007033, partial [Borealophlyctis nickersoniae]
KLDLLRFVKSNPFLGQKQASETGREEADMHDADVTMETEEGEEHEHDHDDDDDDPQSEEEYTDSAGGQSDEYMDDASDPGVNNVVVGVVVGGEEGVSMWCDGGMSHSSM